MVTEDWVEMSAAAALEAGLASTAIGEQISDPEVESALALVVEGLFRGEASHQYAGWPPESTTDGSSVHLLLRTGERLVEAYGVTDFDFSGDVFPFRAEFRHEDGKTGVTISIGQVKTPGGPPPRLPNTTVIVAAESDEDATPHAELIAGRRQEPISWTKAIDWPAS